MWSQDLHQRFLKAISHLVSYISDIPDSVPRIRLSACTSKADVPSLFSE